MQNTTTFIIIDDNVIDVLTHRIVLRDKFDNPDIKSFACAQNALEHIKNNYSEKSADKAFLLLDLHMAGMNGWEFLEHFDELDKRIKDRIKIFIVSFCVDPKSEERAALNPNVELFISKPFNKKKLSGIFDLYPSNRK